MDRVRFGRALGYGARHAAKTLMAAADAAAAPGPAAAAAQPAQSVSQNVSPTRAAAHPPQPRPAAPRPVPVSPSRMGAVSTHASASGRNMVSSVKRFSGSVMLQVVGTFFALFAATFAGAAWRLRAAFHQPAGTPEAHRLYAVMLMFLVFSYFAVSSFLRAHRLERA